LGNILTDNILPFIGVFLAFVLLYIVVPYILLGFKLKRENFLYNVFASMTVGTFFVVFLVYDLACIKILYRYAMSIENIVLAASLLWIFF